MEEIKLLGEIRAKVDFTGQYGESQEDQGMDPKVDLELKGNLAGLVLLLADIQEEIGIYFFPSVPGNRQESSRTG